MSMTCVCSYFDNDDLLINISRIPIVIYRCTNSMRVVLTAHNWQKWKKKRVFLKCPCHEIERDEAVRLKSGKYTLKFAIYVCGIWGNFVKIWYFVTSNCLIEVRIETFFCTCVTHITVIICSTAHFVLPYWIFS